MSTELIRRIETQSAKMSVVGLGYVGLPVACSFASKGFDVIGLDVIADKVARINSGRSPIEGEEEGLDELLSEAVGSGRLRATTDYSIINDRDVVIVAVETPVDDTTKRPRFAALHSALTMMAPHLRVGSLVIIESTIAPRTMADVVRPLLERESGLRVGEDFHLVHCPERLTPRRLLRNLKSMPRVVGGTTPEAAEAAVALYRFIVDAKLNPTDCLTAELVKTAENAYRDVQIAFANELALMCEAIGGDVWTVREFMNQLPGRQMLLPGAGVGGHCIPKDPWLLVAAARDTGYWPQLIPTARAVNDRMPLHVAHLTATALEQADRSVTGARVAILGYAYLENSDDTRNSPSRALANHLEELGATIVVHDPYVREFAGSIVDKVRDADCLVVMVAHDDYRDLDWRTLRQVVRTPVVVDGRHLLGQAELATAAGFTHLTVGIAHETISGEIEADTPRERGLVAAV
jgi:UDP-N-acetyl-D-mannosaminuronic acid dehydrogenase